MESKNRIGLQLPIMNVLQITSVNLESLADGAKVFPVVAENGHAMENHHGLEPHQGYTIQEIHIRAETVTPLLKEILDHVPVPHWENNG